MDKAPVFAGVSQETLDFLRGLREHNNKAWFEAHKAEYQDHLLEPAVQLVAALGERMKAISEDIRYGTEKNGTGSLMRIYRDVRFSKDKTPYKDRVAMGFWEGEGKKIKVPGFGMEFGVDGAGLMAGLFAFDKDQLQRYRDAVDDDALGAGLEAAIAEVMDAGDYELNGKQYKTVPRGYDKDHPRGELLKYGGLWVSKREIPVDVMTSPAFIDVCMAHFKKMAPVEQWLVKVMN